MDIRITLPDLSDEATLALAPQVATIAVLHLQGKAVPVQAPPGTSNQCEDDHCQLVGRVWEDGVLYLLYYCEGKFEVYKA
ncbi:MAG: hypothetical protein KA020_00125 [Planctomycetes bacterium]|jgi:hypothetical protein|nr:hypothetical protein [Planctomycetota bacterium]MCC7063430.1 hypothetical protein [Planctomycetota bacterium]